MKPTLEELIARIERLENIIKQFENASQLDPLYAKTITQLISNPSSKLASSETVTISDTNGANPVVNYYALGEPTGFIRIGDNDVPYY